MLSQALAGSKSPTGYAQVHAAHRSPVQPQRPAPPVSRTPNRSQPTAVIASPPNKTHRGSSAVLQVLGVAKPDRSSTRSLTPNARSQTATAQPQDGRNRSQNGRTSPSPSTTSSAFGGARADALSGEIFRSKLQSIMLLREQIEQLAAKHKMEEEALTRVLNSIHFEDDRSDADGLSLVKRTQEELLSAVKERDKTIEMLDTFRREGSAVIQRMHESLRKSAEQNEQLLRQIESLTKENQALKADLGGATSPQSQATVAEYERRAQTYLELLNEGDEVIKELRARNETLVQALASRSAGEPSTVNGGNSDDAKKVAHLQKRVEELQDQLRTEQRARLQSEEQSQIILQEHRRNNELLEQRLAHQSQRDRGGTPRQTIAPQARRSSTSASLSSPLAQIEGQTVPEAQRSVSGVREESRSAPETEAKTVTENPVAPPAEPGEASGSSPVKDTQLSTCRDRDDEQGDDEDDDELEHEENLRHLNDIARQLQSLQATFDSQ